VVVTFVVNGSGKARNGQPFVGIGPTPVLVGAVEVAKLVAAAAAVGPTVAAADPPDVVPLGGGDREGGPPLHSAVGAGCCNGDLFDGDGRPVGWVGGSLS
jgi:hypothetical protein